MRLLDLTEDSIRLFHNRFKNRVLYYTEEEHELYLNASLEELETVIKYLGLRLEGNQLLSSYPIINELKMIIGILINEGSVMLEYDLTVREERLTAKELISQNKGSYLHYVGSEGNWYKDKKDIIYILGVYESLELLDKDTQHLFLELYFNNTQSIQELLELLVKYTVK